VANADSGAARQAEDIDDGGRAYARITSALEGGN
jgi:hypothetical protein